MKVQCVRIGSEIPTIVVYVDIRIQAENYAIYTRYQVKNWIAWHLIEKKIMIDLYCPSFLSSIGPIFVP